MHIDSPLLRDVLQKKGEIENTFEEILYFVDAGLTAVSVPLDLAFSAVKAAVDERLRSFGLAYSEVHSRIGRTFYDRHIAKFSKKLLKPQFEHRITETNHVLTSAYSILGILSTRVPNILKTWLLELSQRIVVRRYEGR
jgi:hypothetical protein